ncbi:hypothetical protein EYR40_002551 [Pleurotus pulmonarius]|nr:hypothetical protein EYR40_002551 [Pleurotus pulmonarius]KAF4600406.1 hypothetical protein EYR38_005033 [Pleurotus pulmonarius]
MTGDRNELIHVVGTAKYTESESYNTSAFQGASPSTKMYKPVIDLQLRRLRVDVKVGQTFSTDKLTDYDEAMFEDSRLFVVQRAIYDVGRRLVRPWEEYSALKPGTIVLVRATLQHTGNPHLTQWQFDMKQIDVLIPAHLLEDNTEVL